MDHLCGRPIALSSHVLKPLTNHSCPYRWLLVVNPGLRATGYTSNPSLWALCTPSFRGPAYLQKKLFRAKFTHLQLSTAFSDGRNGIYGQFGAQKYVAGNFQNCSPNYVEKNIPSWRLHIHDSDLFSTCTKAPWRWAAPNRGRENFYNFQVNFFQAPNRPQIPFLPSKRAVLDGKRANAGNFQTNP